MKVCFKDAIMQLSERLSCNYVPSWESDCTKILQTLATEFKNAKDLTSHSTLAMTQLLEGRTQETPDVLNYSLTHWKRMFLS